MPVPGRFVLDIDLGPCDPGEPCPTDWDLVLAEHRGRKETFVF